MLGQILVCPHCDTQLPEYQHWENTAECSYYDTQQQCRHWDTKQIVCSGTHSYQCVRTWTHGSVRTGRQLAKSPCWDTHLAVSAFEHKGPKLYTPGCDIILTHSLRSLQEQYGVVVRLRHGANVVWYFLLPTQTKQQKDATVSASSLRSA